MTSEDRRLGRYERRKAKRDRKRNAWLSQYDFSIMTDADRLYSAFKRSMKGVAWKASVQGYEANALKNVADARRKLKNGENVQSGFVEFILRERGKVRHIKSVHISERIVQKCLCDEILVPLLSRPLIYDNGASIKDKGVHFAIKRLILHLSSFYRHNGFSNSGYALQVDFSKFFDSIVHKKLFEMLDRYIVDPKVNELTRRFVSVFGDGKSLGLGSQVSQISAILYPNEVDHAVKEKLGIKYYGRYMDDLYLIHNSKEHLQYCLSEIMKICDPLGIMINHKKTKIVKLSEGVSFLKGKYALTETGKVLRLPGKDSTKRMRRKLKKFKQLVEDGKMNYTDVRNAYQSWRGNYRKRFNAHYRIKHMDGLYNELFINCRNDPAGEAKRVPEKRSRQGQVFQNKR